MKLVFRVCILIIGSIQHVRDHADPDRRLKTTLAQEFMTCQQVSMNVKW